MWRFIIVVFWTGVQAVKSRRRHPVEQRIDHFIGIIQLYPFEAEILAQDFLKRSVLYSSRREQVQIQSTTFTN
jgi:hypothetical protein